MKYRNIFFDLDGTLADSADGVINSVIHALAKQGIKETDRNNLSVSRFLARREA